MIENVLISTITLSAFSLIGLAFFYFKESTIDRAMLILTAFASGALLGVTLIYALPAALGATLSAALTLSATLFGIMVIFVLERVFYWHHMHEGIREIYPFSYLNVMGDGIHNLINGMAIAAAFGISFTAGGIVTLALLAHAIPQELSDFALLLHGGINKRKALSLTFASAAMSIVGALVVWYLLAGLNIGAYVLAFAAGTFIYAAAVDLVPRLQRDEMRNRSVIQLAGFLVGTLLIQMLLILSS